MGPKSFHVSTYKTQNRRYDKKKKKPPLMRSTKDKNLDTRVFYKNVSFFCSFFHPFVKHQDLWCAQLQRLTGNKT